ncbi:hypothetical protein CO058_04160 [candidate division WWE3 bacterium CG_4_9_14_0_2_um_filter_35_11]|uniref:AtpZ/AtpI family protein n=1 Tax=candidate division WWE3 bacterium CG_4_9_14_0_2_um_filter_35_11 TaxID=1975077 RepID=A0A2M8EKV5_UNCKA|nr:MAG: hypothetical protein COV25_03405 [candidate division WWE3 bacterium CG10_big_fil_rev_8_21_14_0_10_35_32]PJC23330.1 MAG: hypothetical protein CO058_04160 [candidate division WWE3 bacterium CG_4_9_14_0_2_um_filter_35_11]
MIISRMKKTDKEYLENFKRNRIKAFGSIAGITFGVVIIFFLIGYYIDTTFNTKPYGIIILLVVSFPIVQVILYRILKKIYSDKN